MPKLNPYLIPKENLPKTEEIVYLDQDYRPQSYEEFMKTYEPSEVVEVITEAEWQDRLLHGPQYGPGNGQSSDFGGRGYPRGHPKWVSAWSGGSSSNRVTINAESVVFVSEGILKAAVATALTTATGGWAPIVGGGMWIGGEWLQSKNDEFLRFVGSHLQGIGGGTFFGGLFANSNVGEVAKKSGISLKDLERLFEMKGSVETIWEVGKHSEHKNKGISYDSNCEVCRL